MRLLIIVLLPFAIQSCNITGAAIGYLSDANKSNKDHSVDTSHIDIIRKGNLIDVHTTDGLVFRGKFKGVVMKDSAKTLHLRSRSVRHIRFEKISKVDVKKQRAHNWLIGSVVGLAVDALIISSMMSIVTEYN